jgi:hypothetical protein
MLLLYIHRMLTTHTDILHDLAYSICHSGCESQSQPIRNLRTFLYRPRCKGFVYLKVEIVIWFLVFRVIC